MRFAYLATALLSFMGILATPTLSKATELEARADGADLEARTFFGCSIIDKLKCHKKGSKYQWDSKSCHCEPVGESSLE